MLWSEFGKAVEKGKARYEEAVAGDCELKSGRKEIYPASSAAGDFANKFFVGDNRDAMLNLLKGNLAIGLPSYAGKIRLIYIDPPFDSQRLYHYQVNIGSGENAGMLRQIAYSDRYEHQTFDYLEMLSERLYYMRDLLTEDGSILLHIDYHISHYVKILMDEVFGRNRFINEIVWCYGGGGAPKKHYTRKHDVILWYAKGKDWFFTPQYRPYSKGTMERGLTAVKGERYELHREGAMLDDWWSEPEVQKFLSPTAKENVKYETQKPEGLLRRIIQGHSAEGDIVADFFSGSGTTGVVAEKMGRKWIMADQGEPAFRVTRRRILELPRYTAFEAYRLEEEIPSENPEVQVDVQVQETLGGPVLIASLLHYTVNVAALKGMSAKQKKLLTDQEKTDWLQLIEHWDVDPDYGEDGVFHAAAHSIRLYEGKKAGIKSVEWQLFLPLREKKEGRTVAVRLVDVLGGETFLTVPLP